MAVDHGYRVFKVSAYPNRMHGNDPLLAGPTSGLVDQIFEILELLSTRNSTFISPRSLAGANGTSPQLPTESISIGAPRRVNDTTIALVVSQGVRDLHQFATHPKKKKKKLKGHSAEADHFVSFHFPNVDDQSSFLVVSHTIRRKDVIKRLLQVIALVSLELREAAKVAEKEERAAIRKAGGKLPPKQTHYRLAFNRCQAKDDDYIDHILGAAKSVSVTFTAMAPSDRGGPKPTVEKTLTVKLTTDGLRKGGQRISRGWTKRRRENLAVPKAEGLQELATELNSHGVLEEGDLDGYDSSRINVSAGIESTTIAVDTLKDVFTYPVHRGRPYSLFFFERVEERLSKIALQEGLDIDPIIPKEIAECLDVSA